MIVRRQFLALGTAGVFSSIRLGPIKAATPLAAVPSAPCTNQAAPSFPPALSVPFNPPVNGKEIILPKRPTRVRSLLSSLQGAESRHYRDSLTRGYAKIAAKSLHRPDDHLGLLDQARTHGYFCDRPGADMGVQGIHDTWEFLAWHRGFLYFHERLLEKILGDKDFRLPVWDWESGQTVPAPWTNPQIANELAVACPNRSSKLPFAVDNCRLLAWLYANDFAEFVGQHGIQSADDFLRFDRSDPGRASGGVHNDVHQFLLGAFSDLSTAGVDPLFYAHHGNVDRYWSHWASQLAYKVPDGFCQQKLFFYDEHGQPVIVRAEQLLDTEALGYVYDPPTLLLRGLSSVFISDLSFTTLLTSVLPAATSWMNDQDRSRVLSTLSDLTALRSAVSRLLNLAGRASNDLTLALSRLFADTTFSIPVQFRIKLPAPPTAGQYYSIAIHFARTNTSMTIGGFGVLSSHMHSDVSATGCLGPKELQRILLEGTEGTSLIYGPANNSAQILGAGTPITGSWNLIQMPAKAISFTSLL